MSAVISYLSENMNSPPNDDLRFWNFVLLNHKLKKQKWQCSHNIDMNPTYLIYSKRFPDAATSLNTDFYNEDDGFFPMHC